MADFLKVVAALVYDFGLEVLRDPNLLVEKRRFTVSSPSNVSAYGVANCHSNSRLPG